MAGVPSGGRLAGILAAVFRLGQARATLALAALVGLLACLTTHYDLTRLLLTGAAGLVLLSLGLFRDSAGRLVFTGASILLLLAYGWAGTESVRLDVALDGRRIWATVEDRTTFAELPSAGRGQVGLGIAPAYWPTELAASNELLGAAARAFGSNLAAGVQGLTFSTLDDQPLAGPFAYAEPDVVYGPPLAVDPTSDLPTVGTYRLMGRPDWQDLRASLELRNGGPPVTLLLRLDERLNGLAVRAWPERRELTIIEVREGRLTNELAGGYQTLRKPALAGFQSLAREILRAWLVSMALLALGVLLAPINRLVPGPGDWRAPAGIGLAMATVLGSVAFSVTGWIASDVLERIPHVQDSVAYLFQAKTFALGRLSAPLPPVPEAFEHEFILQRNGAWFSKYPPGHPVLLALGVLAGVPWLVSPLAAALTLVLLYALGRELFDGTTGLVGALLLLSSPFFLFMSGTMMSHPTGLLLATLGLWLVTLAARSDRATVLALAGLSLGWLMCSRQLTGLAITLPAVAWLAVRRVQGRWPLGGLLWMALGGSWPVLGLLAYNRALTGNPLQNPFELWWDFDRIGFGPTIGMHGGHELARGLWNTYANLTQLESHLFGWPTYLTLAFALLPFVTGRARAGDWLCGAASAGVMVAHVFYWADGIMYGPRYYYEMSGCLALLTARGIFVAAEASSGVVRLAIRRREPRPSAALFLLIVGGLLVGNVLGNLPRQVELHRGYNYVDGSRLEMVRAAGLHRALVLVPTSRPYAWWDYGSVFSANDPLLQGEVIFGRDLGPEANRRTMAAFPDRATYLLSGATLVRLTP